MGGIFFLHLEVVFLVHGEMGVLVVSFLLIHLSIMILERTILINRFRSINIITDKRLQVNKRTPIPTTLHRMLTQLSCLRTAHITSTFPLTQKRIAYQANRSLRRLCLTI